MRIVAASLMVIAFVAAPALAQPQAATTTTAPVTPSPPPGPPATPSPPPVTTTPPVTSTPPVTTAPPPETAPVNQPVQQAAPPPPAPIELSPDVPYPNGLADPVENLTRADNDRDGGGFPWGLLGLLGLLGLVPWLRGGPKTIYVEREKPKPTDERG